MSIEVRPILHHDPRVRKTNQVRWCRLEAQRRKSADDVVRLERDAALNIVRILGECVPQGVERTASLRKIRRHIALHYAGRILEKNQPTTRPERTRAFLNQQLLPVAI